MDRSLYSNLLSWRNERDRKPLILDGARQTGKTWLLRTFGEREFRRMHYFNFEADPDICTIFDSKLSPDTIIPLLELATGQSIQVEQDLIVFDEIQLCPRAMTSLKYFAEERPEFAVCCAGSLIGLAGSTESYPVGKVTTRSLFPVSFRESLAAVEPQLHRRYDDFISSPRPLTEMVHRKLSTRMLEYFVAGGMPEATNRLVQEGQLHGDLMRDIASIHSDLVTGFQSDFAKHAGKVNAQHLSRVFESVPAQLSHATDGNAGRYRFKGVTPNSHRYRDLSGAIDWLATTGLIHQVHVIESPVFPLKPHVRESIFKLYLLDIGLLHSMLDVSPLQIVQQSWGAYKGYAAENFVAQELRANGVKELYCWKGSSSEIEFLIHIEDLVVPIEVKSGTHTRRSKSLSAYREKYDPEISVKVSGNNFQVVDRTVHLPLYAVGAIPQIIRNIRRGIYER